MFINRFLKNLLFLGFLLVLFIQAACQNKAPQQEDWMKKPMQTCMKRNKENIKKLLPVAEYCECLIPKIHEFIRADRGKVILLKEGDLDFLVTDLSLIHI